MPSTTRLNPGALRWEVTRLFLWLGLTAFGGPAAHIALMEQETVRRRAWVSSEEFLDLLGATHLIPGPNSTELAMHLGFRRAGWWGLWLAGIAFILPAALIVACLSVVYVHFGMLPSFGGFLRGVQAVMIAIVVQAAWGLGKTALKGVGLMILAAGTLALNLAGVHELLLLLAAGCLRLVFARPPPAPAHIPAVVFPTFAWIAPGVFLTAVFSSLPKIARVFLVFFKTGTVLYGSGYVLLSFLNADLVERLQWITPGQLVDSVAVGQATPGPVLTTATFLGYLVAGPWGAAAATVGIFLPAFTWVALTCRWLPRLRRHPHLGSFVDGVNAGSLGLLAGVALSLGRAAILDRSTAAIAIISVVLLIGLRAHSVVLLLAGGVAGWAFSH